MKRWNGGPVLVTGATGLLGSAMVAELLARGADVVCLVRDWVPASELVRSGDLARARVVRGDLCDLETVLRALNEHEVESVFHLGAQTIVGTAGRSPLSTFESNIRGTWILLEACRLVGSGVKRVVVASSDKAYGAQERLPYTEDTPLAGTFPYDVSKSCTDLISLSYHHAYGLPVAITRCGNLYGGGDLNWSRIVPGTIRSALRGERPVVRSDGTYVRDYFYVRDAVDAYLTLAARLPAPGLSGLAFNFGNETPVTVLEIVAKILRAVGRTDLVPDVRGEASREIKAQYLDCTRARTLLDWKPGWTLDAGLEETVGWYRALLAKG